LSQSARRTLLILAFVTVAASPVFSQDTPSKTDLQEKVHVGLAQMEVTVWPKKHDDPTTCRGFTADDFYVTVNGRNREIIAVDWLGSAEAMSIMEDQPVKDVENPPMTMVLLFDLWHLDIFYRSFDCPITKPLAFEQARAFIKEEFRPGDRLLLVTFAGWPLIHEGWIRNPEEALRALDRLEVDPFVLNPRRSHSHHHVWIDGIKSLLLALGQYPGRKEVIYLADDFRFDDVAMQVNKLATRAQANQVSMHAVDLLASCRTVPGPGCTFAGGLGCTDFRKPIALGYVAASTGGILADSSTATIASTVKRVRSMRGCRYLVSLPMRRSDDRRAPRATVHTTRKGFQLIHPRSFGSPKREPDERDRQDALFLLPHFGRGLTADVGLWPLRPSGKRKQWSGVMVARLGPTDPWPDSLERIEITAVASTHASVYGSFTKVIEGAELKRFREEKLMVFPLEKIPPGDNTVALRAVGVGAHVSANVRALLDVSDPPELGEASGWFLSKKLARLGETVTLLPTLDGVLNPEDGGALILGFGCPGDDEVEDGRLVALADDASVPISIDWLDGAIEGEACGWLAGRVDAELAAGLWRFEPPESLMVEDAEPSTIEFRVAE